MGKEEEEDKSRTIRSCYREIENRIKEKKDEIANATSNKFVSIMNQVEIIHTEVTKPREQVADAETLLGLTNILMDSVRSNTAVCATPPEFVSCLIKQFGLLKRHKVLSDNSYTVSWLDIGSCVSPIFMSGSGCRTMNGPMLTVLKQRKPVVRAKRARSLKRTHPEEFKIAVDLMSDTDRNIHVMFEVLKRRKKVRVETLILNRDSFSQTIENLFAMAFLVKDGRVHIYVNDTGARVVAPRNGPSAEEIRTGVATNHQFIFRLDFNDWEEMKEYVPYEKEVMPQRYAFDISSCSAKSIDEDGIGIPEGIPIDTQTQFVCTV
ncbi:hypothetical protein SASPL_107284 [Salvia splendens]|uniref:Non-structural maintenance of chromosomes element 4 n=1 Tax=Salvia splendens TaxID=180675 RepID=A0A8X9A755_SALSN|nr:hypothetical protein SASPL_107284 [Salvia splendens]